MSSPINQQPTYPGAVTSMISYGDRVQGFLAVPEHQPGPFGAVILGHERYGLVQHTLDLVAKFAAHGWPRTCFPGGTGTKRP